MSKAVRATLSHSRFLPNVRLVLFSSALPAKVPQKELPSLSPKARAETLRVQWSNRSEGFLLANAS